jgi:putative DNA-invertase from lambdoid prophage Rac
VVAWRLENAASIKQTAQKFGLSDASVKRYCAAAYLNRSA